MPARQVELHPEALIEARAAFEWYRERNPAAAAAFLTEVDTAINEISTTPNRWPGFLHGTRRFLLRRFPFSVVYRVTDAVIQVVAFAHARRRPAYWRDRGSA
ncbi:MAG: type II toxin-antitoxin system RelE/ParE family toxin [Burkholderiales bacterium]|nr:type II toxin-antitoxin system RelE/ParE family toxin [Burkholderiales bacterium]